MAFFVPVMAQSLIWLDEFISGVPAPTNLDVPPYRYVTDTQIIIGEACRGESSMKPTRIAGLQPLGFRAFPLSKLWNDHMAHYYAPKNFNFWYFFGSLALLVLVNQFITGILLTMNYKPDAKLAFDSVEYIMRDVNWGWLVRYMHSTGASAFFIVVYLHMFRGMMYGSFKQPRELIWIFGMLIFVCFDGRSLYGLFVTLGTNVLLGRTGDYLLV